MVFCFRVSKSLSIIWFCVALAAGCASTRSADERTCAVCGEPLADDAYVSEGEKYYHGTCYADHVILCTYCKKPLNEETLVTYDGKNYHRFCFQTYVVTCAYCGKRITDENYKSSQGKYYHDKCFEEFVVPRCAFCRNPIRDKTYTSSEGKNYHTSCYEEFVVLKCTLCGERIEANYFTDFWGGTYHASHRSDSPSCDSCGRFLKIPLEAGAVKYDDGRCLCRSCGASAVTTREEMEGLAAMVSERLRRIGIQVDVDSVSHQMVEAGKMRQLNRHHSHRQTGLTICREEVAEAPGRTTYEYIDVYLLYGMPRVQMIAAIAHELTHVWQLLHGRLRIYVTLAEGSCQYASYLVLKEIPGGESEYLIHVMTTDDDKVYGGGFRRVKRYAEENGIPRWLTLLENNEPLPRY